MYSFLFDVEVVAQVLFIGCLEVLISLAQRFEQGVSAFNNSRGCLIEIIFIYLL